MPTPTKEDPQEFVVPTDARELEAMLGRPADMQRVFGNKDLFGEFISNYANTVMQKNQEIATQVREETQRVLGNWLRESGPDIAPIAPLNFTPQTGFQPVVDPSSSGITMDMVKKQGLFNSKAMGAAINGEFANSAEYFQAIWHNTNRDAKLQAKLHRMKNAFSSTVPSEGGFLIPETLRSELLRVSLESAIVRPRARVIPMETLRVPFRF